MKYFLLTAVLLLCSCSGKKTSCITKSQLDFARCCCKLSGAKLDWATRSINSSGEPVILFQRSDTSYTWVFSDGTYKEGCS